MKKVIVKLPGDVTREVIASNVSEAANLAGLPAEGFSYLMNNMVATGEEAIPYDYTVLVANKAVKGGNSR